MDNPKDGATLLNEVCLSNPVGCGWLHKRWFKALRKARLARPKTLPTPQIEWPNDSPLSTPLMAKHPKGELDARAMARIARAYGRSPAGFGPLGKAWAPRLALAGTYDARWLDERHPRLPEDFDFAYWNGAPADQQIDFPDLTGLIFLDHGGALPYRPGDLKASTHDDYLTSVGAGVIFNFSDRVSGRFVVGQPLRGNPAELHDRRPRAHVSVNIALY